MLRWPYFKEIPSVWEFIDLFLSQRATREGLKFCWQFAQYVILGAELLLKDCLGGGSWLVVFSLTFLNSKNAYLVIVIFPSDSVLLCTDITWKYFSLSLCSSTNEMVNSGFLESVINANGLFYRCTQWQQSLLFFLSALLDKGLQIHVDKVASLFI